MGDVGVLPALVEQPAVVEHCRTPIVVLVVRQAANAPVGIAQIEIGDHGAAAHARHADKRRRGGEHDPAVGKIAGVVVVHVRVFDQRQPRQTAAGQAEFGNPPAAMAVGRGQKQTVSVVVQIDVADECIPVRLENRRQFAVGPNGR